MQISNYDYNKSLNETSFFVLTEQVDKVVAHLGGRNLKVRGAKTSAAVSEISVAATMKEVTTALADLEM